jgi:hypothetical protein
LDDEIYFFKHIPFHVVLWDFHHDHCLLISEVNDDKENKNDSFRTSGHVWMLLLASVIQQNVILLVSFLESFNILSIILRSFIGGPSYNLIYS